jgi:quinol monooxygenase YgiN
MFIQLVTFTTTKIDELREVDAAWRQATAGRNTVLRERVYADRDRPDTYIVVCEFASYEDAMVNSNLPETAECAAAIDALCDGPATFTNLELVEEFAPESVA